jgi:DNA sulfur modification protein DndB
VIGEIPDVVVRTVGKMTYAFATIPSDRVKSITFVPVVEPSAKTFLREIQEDGYQRPGSPSRMRLFARFLRDNPDHVVPPVLLSGRGNWEFVPSKHNPTIGSLRVKAPAAIIDGQHRLGGFVALYEEDEDVRDVPFILLNGLSVEAEKSEFAVVNNSQKGVPKSLIAWIDDELPAQVAWQLNMLEDSPLKGRISRVQMKKDQLFQLHSAAKHIDRLFSIGAVSELDLEQRVEYASRYFTIIADALPEEWADIARLDEEGGKGRKGFEYKLLELTGLIAWCWVGAQIFARSYSDSTGMNWDNVERLVDAAKVVEWHKEGQYRGLTGEVGGKRMADDMLRLLPAEGE